MKSQGPCRDCSETIEVAPEKVEKTLQILMNSKHTELADEVTSSKRLALCMSCTANVHGGTCKYCGCLVQIRTKIKGQICPFPFAPKW